MMSAPLDGVVVVSIEQAISAPFASRQLADLGATVIKVERPEGDFARHYDHLVGGTSAFFVWANRGKHSVTVDVNAEADVSLLHSLIAGADVVLHNMSPAAARRRGFDADTLRASRPELIVCEISGYGIGGPRGEDKAYDLAIQAEAGAFSVNGNADEMSKVGFSVADISSGMYALTSILAALVRRDRTGEGASIEVSMLESLSEWMSAPMYAAVYGPGQAPRTGRRHHAIAPYGTFHLSDGSTILIAVQSDGEWRSLAEQLGHAELGTDPRFATNPARVAHVAELEQIIQSSLDQMSAEEAHQRLASGRIAVARVNDLRGVWNHEQLRARTRIQPVRTEFGPVDALIPPFNISDSGTIPDWIPALGEHDSDLIARITSGDQ